MLFFVINVFAEIPHSYVTENPDKEVTQTETLKKHKEKAELNLSITKIKSKEVEGLHNPEQKKIYFNLDNIEYEIQPGDHIYVSEELQEVPSISTTNGRKKINGMLNQKVLKEGSLEYIVTNERTTSKIEVSYSKTPKEIYIGILNNQYQIKKILKGNVKKTDINLFAYSDSLGMLFDKNFDIIGWGDRSFNEEIFNSKSKYGNNTFIKTISGTNKIKIGHTTYREGNLHVIIEGYDKSGNKVYTSPALGRVTTYNGNGAYSWAEKNWSITLPEHYILVIKAAGYTGDPKGDNSNGDNTIDIAQIFNVKLDDFIHKADGVSNLIVDENYEPEYIKFDSCTIETIKPLSLLNSPKGVKLASTSGDGLLHLDPTDTLEINGQKHILASSNLAEQKLELNKIKLSYKVENGKLELKVDEYGLETSSPQAINIKIVKDKDIKDVMEHTINLTVPYIQKIIGESDLSVDEYYDKSEYITLSSCTLENPQDVSLVTPIEGVTLKQYKGKGIVKFEPGDILEVNGVQSTVNGTGGVSERSENIGGVSIYYKAQNGNFQIRVNDYKIEQESPQTIILKLLRNGKEIMDQKIYLYVPKLVINNSKMNVKIRDEYKEEYFNIYNLPYNVKGIEFLSGDKTISVITPGNYREKREYGGFWINGVQVVDRKGTTIPERTLNFEKYTVKTQRNGNLIISLSNYPKKISEPIELTLKSYTRSYTPGHDYGGDNDGHNGSGSPGHWSGRTREQIIVFYYVPSKVVGQSTLEVKEYYPTPEYIAFNSCTTPAPAPIELENSLRDVKVIQNSGNGLVNLEQGDILQLNGKQYTIGTGGTLPEQSDILGNINFKFKVENGKIRLALTSWGVLEPDRLLTINASREGHPIMEHKMTIKAPRRVEGTSTLTFTEKYPIRDIVRLQGISLTAPNIGGIEPPIPAGVSYKSNDGYGIPFMKEGDILKVQCETMRATQKYIIDSKNSLKHQTIDLPGTVLSLLVEDGKLRLGLNNWLVNKNTVLNFRLIRGVNEISNTSITLEVPKAPFDILKNGILDFGKLIQGSKNKKAETSILLEMHQDISNVKFSLSTSTPELVNSSGATLQARDLQAGVQKQGNKRHLVRIIGRLDVPEKQELGVYRGSVLLNVTIK